MILIVKKLLERNSDKTNQKTKQTEFSIEKAIKTKGNKLYVNWKDYSSFNSSIDKNDIVI